MYPTEELNVWEYKLSNWLNLYKNEIEIEDEQLEVICIKKI